MTTENTTTATTTETSNKGMKCAQVIGFTETYGDVNDIMTFTRSAPIPTLSSSKAKKKKQMIIKVLACSIAAGDTIVLGGNVVFLRPKFPFVPGMDVCGIVQEITPKVTKFKVGDVVVGNNGFMPVGGMAEYMILNESMATLKPHSVNPIAASASSSAVTALHAIDLIHKGDRVLILGGSGGVGSSAIALAKLVGKASFVATTSTQKDMCMELGADHVIDYTHENWWELEDYQKHPFDVIIDTVGGGNYYGCSSHVLKPAAPANGRFIAVTGDDPRPDLSTWFKAIQFIFRMPQRSIYTSLFRRTTLAKYITLLPHDEIQGLARVLKLMEDDENAHAPPFRIVLDPSSPHQFSEDGVKSAYTIQGSGHAHGKVVVTME